MFTWVSFYSRRMQKEANPKIRKKKKNKTKFLINNFLEIQNTEQVVFQRNVFCFCLVALLFSIPYRDIIFFYSIILFFWFLFHVVPAFCSRANGSMRTSIYFQMPWPIFIEERLYQLHFQCNPFTPANVSLLWSVENFRELTIFF